MSSIPVYPPSSNESVDKSFKDAQTKIIELGADWVLITYGYGLWPWFDSDNLVRLIHGRSSGHACISAQLAERKKGYLVHDDEGRYIP
jgi:hypothetical protein